MSIDDFNGFEQFSKDPDGFVMAMHTPKKL
jgi:hypothetical protein